MAGDVVNLTFYSASTFVVKIATFGKPKTISKMNTTPEHNSRMGKMSFTGVYPLRIKHYQ
jgi:hypothetical protein